MEMKADICAILGRQKLTFSHSLGLDCVSIPRELPGTNDNFGNIRLNNKLFVDKSVYITKLLKRQNKFSRICRPRQFGKSNFLQMLGSFFRANETLFKGTQINNNQSWKFLYPVLYFDFNAMNVTTLRDFKADLNNTILEMGQFHKVEISDRTSIASQFHDLIRGFALTRRKPYHLVVILVDEYDWPVRQYAVKNKVDEPETQEKMREMGDFLLEFFAVLQSAKKNIRLAFLTCTTPLDLDYWEDGGPDIKDITFDPEFSGMIGLTHEELIDNFEPHIEQLARGSNETFNAIVQKIRSRYDGYCFSPGSNTTCSVYNLHSILSCLRSKRISGDTLWQPTIDPKYNLIDHYTKETHRQYVMKYFSNISIPRTALEMTNHRDYLQSMETCMILFGYLTYRSYDIVTHHFTVDFPNDEVREKFVKELLEHGPSGRLSMNEVFEMCNQLREAMLAEKWGTFIEQLNSMICEHEDNGTRSEYAYADRVIRIFRVCNVENRPDYSFYHEDNSLAGTIDLVTEEPTEKKFRYVFEFEWMKNASRAVEKLLNFSKIQDFVENLWCRKISLMGINFGPQGGMIDEWIELTYENGNFTELQASHPQYLAMYAHIVGG